MADKSNDDSKAIEILVDLDSYFAFITGKVIFITGEGKFGVPVTLKSSFGYILSGQYKKKITQLLISMKHIF